MKFFHPFANGRTAKNTICSIQRGDGSMATNFEDLATKVITLFQNLFNVDQRSIIESILRVAIVFPSFVDLYYNDSLMVEVRKDDLQKILHKFQKDKISGPDGLLVEFYASTFDILGDDLLKTK
jgi:hypothetical protein